MIQCGSQGIKLCSGRQQVDHFQEINDPWNAFGLRDLRQQPDRLFPGFAMKLHAPARFPDHFSNPVQRCFLIGKMCKKIRIKIDRGGFYKINFGVAPPDMGQVGRHQYQVILFKIGD